MVSEIVRDVFFLGQKSVPATKDDLDVADKLIATKIMWLCLIL